MSKQFIYVAVLRDARRECRVRAVSQSGCALEDASASSNPKSRRVEWLLENRIQFLLINDVKRFTTLFYCRLKAKTFKTAAAAVSLLIYDIFFLQITNTHTDVWGILINVFSFMWSFVLHWRVSLLFYQHIPIKKENDLIFKHHLNLFFFGLFVWDYVKKHQLQHLRHKNHCH